MVFLQLTGSGSGGSLTAATDSQVKVEAIKR
jgi:hypothetical protein